MKNKYDELIRSNALNIASQALKADDWFQDSVRNIAVKSISKNPFKQTDLPQIGSMYLYRYDPKHKKTLPVYDVYPLTFPIEMYSDGFLGINLHYLPPLARLGLMRALDDIKNNNKYNESTRLNISYRLLKGYSSRFAGVDNCIKRYLFGYVRSSFNYVQPTDWEKVALLPLQRFVGRQPY